MTKEERSAIITGSFAIVAALIAGILGFIGGKSEYVELTKHHTNELNRQKTTLTEIYKERETELILESWRSKARQLHLLRQEFYSHIEPDFYTLENLKSYLDTIMTIEKQFDDIEYLRFLTDHSSKEQRDKFVKLMNERSKALTELQQTVGQALYSLSSNKKIDIEARATDLLNVFDSEIKASAAHTGYIISASIRSISRETANIYMTAPVNSPSQPKSEE